MPDLPPAVPPFKPDVDTAYAELGKAMAYIKQLTTVIQERAVEANQLHDQFLAAKGRIAELEAEIERLRDE